MTAVACPRCKQLVIMAEVQEVGDIVPFNTTPSLVLIKDGTVVTMGCVPHLCDDLPKIARKKPPKPKPWPKVTCKYCLVDVDPRQATFTVEQGWKCYKCDMPQGPKLVPL